MELSNIRGRRVQSVTATATMADPRFEDAEEDLSPSSSLPSTPIGGEEKAADDQLKRYQTILKIAKEEGNDDDNDGASDEEEEDRGDDSCRNADGKNGDDQIEYVRNDDYDDNSNDDEYLSRYYRNREDFESDYHSSRRGEEKDGAEDVKVERVICMPTVWFISCTLS